MKLNLFFLLFVIVMLSSCVTLKPLTFKTVEKVKVDKFSFRPRVDIDLILNNPNTLGLKILDLDMSIKAFDQKLGEVSLDRIIKVHKENDFTVPLNFNTTLGKAIILLPKTIGSFNNGKIIKMEFNGKITLKKWFFQKTFPFHFVENVDTKKIKPK